MKALKATVATIVSILIVIGLGIGIHKLGPFVLGYIFIALLLCCAIGALWHSFYDSFED